MISLTFAEQVKIILSRKGMTIKELAEIIEERTGKKMSRQNLTQRLNRDNFQEQDMRMITEILGCSFQLHILEEVKNQEDLRAGEAMAPTEKELAKISRKREKKAEQAAVAERDITMGELVDMMSDTVDDKDLVMNESDVVSEALEGKEEEKSPGSKSPLGGFFKGYLIKSKGKDRKPVIEESTEDEQEEILEVEELLETEDPAEFLAEEEALQAAPAYPKEQFARKPEPEPAAAEPAAPTVPPVIEEEDLVKGDINPYTGREYQSNSVRIHPKRIGYVQVYDRGEHRWTDMTEWAFLGYQERKKALLGDDYEPPIYLD